MRQVIMKVNAHLTVFVLCLLVPHIVLANGDTYDLIRSALQSTLLSQQDAAFDTNDIHQKHRQYKTRGMGSCISNCLRGGRGQLNFIQCRSMCHPNLLSQEEAAFNTNDIHQKPRQYKKRGMGSCISNCLRGRGQMNFIQCRSMCH